MCVFQFKVVHPQNLKLVFRSKHDNDDDASSSSNEAAKRILTKKKHRQSNGSKLGLKVQLRKASQSVTEKNRVREDVEKLN